MGQKAFFLAWIGLLSAGSVVFAQENVSLSATEDSLSSPNGSITTALLKITNLQNRDFNGKLMLTSNAFLEIVGNPEEKIMLGPKDSLFVSTNILVSQTAVAGKAYGISAILYDSLGNRVSRSDISVNIPEIKKMKLFVRDKQILMEGGDKSIEIGIQLANTGNTNQKVVLLAKLPHTLHAGYLDNLQFEVKAFRDTLIVIRQNITREMLRLDEFTVNITGLYKKGDVFGREKIQVTSIKSERRYRSREVLPIQKNFLLLRARNPGGDYPYYEGSLQTEIRLPGEGIIDLNSNATWREQADDLYFRNTWIGYHDQRFGVRAGNIHKNFETSLNGRGGEAYLYSKNKKNRYEIGAIDKAYRLFETSPHVKGNSFWAHYDFGEGTKKGGSSTFIYDSDALRDYKDMLLSGYTNLISKPGLQLDGGISTGTTTTFSADSLREYGIAAEANLVAEVGKFSFLSNNFVSTSYYPGRKRGGMDFYEKITYRYKKYSFFTTFRHFGYSPKYLSPSQGSESEFGHTKFQVGASKRWLRFSVSLAPEYSRENRFFNLAGSTIDATLSALRMRMGFHYNNADFRHRLFLDVEIGQSHASWNNEDEFQARFRLNYNWGIFNLNGEYQKGSFFLAQALYNQNLHEGYERYFINPNIRLKLFNNKLLLDGGVSYAYDTDSQETFFARGKANYQLPYGLEVFAGIDFYEYAYADFSNQQIEFGLIKRFSTPSVGIPNHTLELFVYKEMNGDDSYTEDVDEIGIGQTLYINGEVFRTNAEGKVIYKKIPTGTYHVRFNSFTGWYARDMEIEVVGDTQVSIGLNKMTTIGGSVGYSSTILSYDIKETLGGLSILAVSKTGETYSTRTDSRGSFVLFVPKGEYTVSLIPPGNMEHVEVTDNGQAIETNPETPIEIKFNVKVKEKQVEYKSFSSTN